MPHGSIYVPSDNELEPVDRLRDIDDKPHKGLRTRQNKKDDHILDRLNT
ncbi:hypothetical protein PPTG_23261 [Phytophthora nicotianae INRA-310]|uniref:Uncharacterized protein n=2 Tax=Phytophthora nicotianae TaxID=4792 RepID=W2Q0M9_PHYN3|nr:hypothetical protein PPTG_23261 [Phytophthora nicotianae INRA-310]ETN06758.1 hypothetical protein PPTG_23261 [Phytophthora nicotianae INRA-310]ETO72103.1 hypothetical protein F444_11674 [Phytophthora nicotianae P1976]